MGASIAVDAPATWVLSNHDVIRHTTRLVRADPATAPWYLEADEPAPDQVLGLRRARAATTLMLALPGSAYLYQGEELGLPEVVDPPAHVRRDPAFVGADGQLLGRDGCRVPLAWVKDALSFGFGGGDKSWLPQPEIFGELALDQQVGRPDSTLELYRSLLRVRRERGLGNGALSLVDLGEDIVAADVVTASGATRVVVNLGETAWPIPEGARVLVVSGSGVTDQLPTDHAVWLADLER